MIVYGEDVIVEFEEAGEWKPYACGRSCSLTVTTEFINVSRKGDGKYKRVLPTINSFTGSIDGVVNLDEPTMLTLADLRKKQVTHTVLRMRIVREATNGTKYIDTAYFYISGSTDTGSVEDVNTFSIELIGTGALEGSLTTTGGIFLNEDGTPMLTEDGQVITTEGETTIIY
ncbi:MAG TPA: hypothetical protein VF622_17960 [Segetibacter sp.]|jgi:hypothetical protein